MDKSEKDFSDGFSSEKTNPKLTMRTFTYKEPIDSASIGVYYLHGNLCLFQTRVLLDEKNFLQKAREIRYSNN